jgi:hypothetical protein
LRASSTALCIGFIHGSHKMLSWRCPKYLSWQTTTQYDQGVSSDIIDKCGR